MPTLMLSNPDNGELLASLRIEPALEGSELADIARSLAFNKKIPCQKILVEVMSGMCRTDNFPLLLPTTNKELTGA